MFAQPTYNGYINHRGWSNIAQQSKQQVEEFKKTREARHARGDCMSSTENVNINNKKLKKFMKLMTPILHTPVLVDITEELPEIMCFQNSAFLEDCRGLEAIHGYNMSACSCGKSINFEIHSLNKKDGKLVDHTIDFAGEKKKWFVALKDQSLTGMDIADKEHRYYNFGKDFCTCGQAIGCRLTHTKHMKRDLTVKK